MPGSLIRGYEQSGLRAFLQRGMFDHTLRTIFDWFAQRDEPSALIMFRNPGAAKEAVPLHCLALALADGLKDGGAVLRALFTLALPAAMTKQTVLGAEKHRTCWNFMAARRTVPSRRRSPDHINKPKK